MVRFQRMAEAFEVVAKVRDCDSSGSEHSPENMADLSDLVNSFIEKGNGVVDRDIHSDDHNSDEIDDDNCDLGEMKEGLKKLFGFGNGGYCDDIKRKLRLEIEKAWRRVIGDISLPPLPEFKRRLMARLREQGLDAGLCKTKWEKNGRLLSGDFEYIDINVNGIRNIIDTSFAREFQIARPTQYYTSLLEVLPQIFICKVEELKQILRIICRAIKKSMKQMKMYVPPWRRHIYVQAKWFGPYKRTTNEFTAKRLTELNLDSRRTVGFISSLSTGRICYQNRNDIFARKGLGFKVGHLAMAMNE